MKSMNLNDLVKVVAEDTKVSKAIAKKIIYRTLGTIMTRVSWRQTVRIVGFGTFKPVNRPARIGRNPKTGSQIHIPFRIRPLFTPSSRFKEKVDVANGKLYMALEDRYMEELGSKSVDS